jgi:hypothetical protein
MKIKEYRNNKGQLDRLDGPAIERPDGQKEWYINDHRHRLDGPAIERKDGSKEWWVNGQLHREDGPAIEWENGSKEWYMNNKPHRLDGPAYEGCDGFDLYYVDGIKYSREYFKVKVIQFLLNCDRETANIVLKLFKK